jgi:hypothetical protein
VNTKLNSFLLPVFAWFGNLLPDFFAYTKTPPAGQGWFCKLHLNQKFGMGEKKSAE